MKIITINALSALRGGGQTYLINFLKYLPKSGVKVLLIVNTKNKEVFDKYKSDQIVIQEESFASRNMFYRTAWEIFRLPVLLRNSNTDVYYAPGGIMVTPMPKDVCSATALQNMLPFDKRERKRFAMLSYLRFKLWLLRFVFLKSYKNVDKVVFISEYSRNVIEGYIPEIRHNSIVAPHGLNSMFLNSKTKNPLSGGLNEEQFYLYVSILDVYKAQKEMILVWKKLIDGGFRYPLVLVGPKYNNYGDEVLKMIQDYSLQKWVIYLGEVEYADLPSLYKAARALIFASSCECCPNILLEKLAAGKPVLCSDIEPMPEFGEEAVLYFDPYSTKSLVEQVELLEGSEDIKKQLGIKAGQQALKFKWSETVNKTVRFLLD